MSDKSRQIRSRQAPNLFAHLFLSTSLVFCAVTIYCILSEAPTRLAKMSSADLAYTIGIECMLMPLAIGVFAGGIVWLSRQDRYRKDPINRLDRITRTKLAKARRQASEKAKLKAQLEKRSHRSRLAGFVNRNVLEPKPTNPPDEVYRSKMVFWQFVGFGNKSAPKPIELIRHLLQRISKLAGN